MSLHRLLAAALVMGHLSVPHDAAAQSSAAGDAALAYATAFQATVYGYPLDGMYRRLSEEVLDPGTRRAAFNSYYHYTQLATPEVAPFPAPNNDTLYSTAWLDLREGPALLSMPETSGRYYTAQIIDMNTDTIANVGQRLNGTGAFLVAVADPGWSGTLPPGVRQVIRSDTKFAYVLLRILVDGPADVPNVVALQRRFTIASLARYARGATGVDDGMPLPGYRADTVEQKLSMLDRVLRLGPMRPGDEGMVASFAPLGVGPFAPTLRIDASAETLGRAEADARALIASVGARTGRVVDGWRMPPAAIGRYGVDYLQRASVWDGGPLANVVEESFYPSALFDADGQWLDGAGRRYVLRFPPGQLPPAAHFWSLTMYRLDDKMLVANPIDRYSVGNRTRGLMKDPDGSLSITIQADKPEQDASNWLPAPRAPFYMVLRLYGPSGDALSGKWRPPPVRRLP